MYKIKRFSSKYLSTSERLKKAGAMSLIAGGGVSIPAAILGALIGAGSSMMKLRGFKEILRNAKNSALKGAAVVGGLVAASVFYSIWNSTSKKYIQDQEKKDREFKKDNDRLKSEYKTWNDIKTKLGYEVPREYLNFLKLFESGNKNFICPLIPYVTEPWVMARVIEEWKEDPESACLVGNGTGDDVESNFFYDFIENEWSDYNLPYPNTGKLSNLILNVYDDNLWKDNIDLENINEEESKRISNSKDLIKRI